MRINFKNPCKHVTVKALNKSFFFIIGILLIVFAFILFYFNVVLSPFLFCYNIPDKYLKSISGHHFIDDAAKIFFLETSCKAALNSRQACSIESAARANTKWKIIVLVTGPFTSEFKSSKLFAILTSFENVFFLRLYVTEFTKDTPIEPLFSKNLVKNSWYPLIHSSDILRLLVLYKYGGIYLDLDIIVVKSFDTLPKNFVLKEGPYSVTNCAMGFSKNGTGESFLQYAMRNLATTYNPASWNDNGQGLLLRTLVGFCYAADFLDISSKTCKGIRILDSQSFSPILFYNWRQYFEDRDLNDYNNIQEYAHHMWNTLSGGIKIPRRSLFARMAKKFCPSVSELYGDEFGN